MWSCYLLISITNKHTYIGATTDVNRRLRQHNGELCNGAKRTKANRPWRILASVEIGEKIPALKLEWKLKRARGVNSRLELFKRLCIENELKIILYDI